MNYIDTHQATVYETYDESIDKTKHQKGMGIKQIAKEWGIGIGIVYSVI